eukprot:TRINITY_DN15857_c0_g1_i1.p1 TRINITY_DN15857_c0_g1~~TRINITY_DN15857_c0_g1_i1.p1  ORF type:complete len:375 (+),score=82.87 TRINITY_DN15857_c0_g1_i1:134-1258(+)
MKKVIVGLTSLTFATGFASIIYFDRLKTNKKVTFEEFHENQKNLPFVLSKFDSFYNSDDYGKKKEDEGIVKMKNGKKKEYSIVKVPDYKEDIEIVFYRYTTCPFCNSLKSFLDYNNIKHSCVEVDPLFKSQIKENNYSKVPQLKIKYKESNITKQDNIVCENIRNEEIILVESTEIPNILLPITQKSGNIILDEDQEHVNKWRTWARECLIRIITLNINDNITNAFNTYGYIDMVEIPTFNKYILKIISGPLMYVIANTVTKKKLIKSGYLNEKQDIRQTLYQHLNYFMENGINDRNKNNNNDDSNNTKRPFIYNQEHPPSLIDLDVYGILSSVRLLPIFKQLEANVPNLKEWMIEMDQLVDGDQAKYIQRGHF